MKSLKNSVNDVLNFDFITLNSFTMEDIKSKLLKLEKELPKNVNLDDFTKTVDGINFSKLLSFHDIMFM
jgi:hypothetical protein